MTCEKDELLEYEPSTVLLKELTVRVLGREEFDRAGRYFDQEHYLGDLATGRHLLQVVEHKGRWMALLDWGASAHRLEDRDRWIGWTGQQRAERQGLLVMNRRFLVLGRERMPNLASKALALACGHLPEHWERMHGYAPVLAESFTDIEQFHGTCYKAAGWQPCGMSKGFAKHRADYYQEHGKLKKHWVKTLNRNALKILTAMDVPPKYLPGLNLQTPERDLPLRQPEMLSLRSFVMENLKDPRRSNKSFPFASMITFVAMALLAGRSSLAAIHRYGQFFTDAHRRALDWPPKKNAPGRKAPSYTAIRNLLHQLDPDAFAACISQWLAAHQGELPRALALDGKWVRDRLLGVTLTEHDSGAPVAVGFAGTQVRDETHKREGEQSVARRLYQQCPLEGAVVTADALHNSDPDARAILEAGGHYFLQVKQENRHSYQNAEKMAQTTPFLFTQNSPTAGTDASTAARPPYIQ
ncbi:MAG TPA: Druantia anti-phage system protein DruA [Opitutales bacterium]|nr:Druantia anti-phage system protein DruA [Opitutales bacterium]